MRTAIFRNNWLTSAALLLVIPGAYFVIIGLLSAFGIPGPLEAIKPFAEKLGIKDPPGLNITSVVLFGPVVALLLTVFQFLTLEWHVAKNQFSLRLEFYKRWFPILVAGVSIGVLAILFLYMFLENCNCH